MLAASEASSHLSPQTPASQSPESTACSLSIPGFPLLYAVGSQAEIDAVQAGTGDMQKVEHTRIKFLKSTRTNCQG